jgi:hypothetical protein
VTRRGDIAGKRGGGRQDDTDEHRYGEISRIYLLAAGGPAQGYADAENDEGDEREPGQFAQVKESETKTLHGMVTLV